MIAGRARMLSASLLGIALLLPSSVVPTSAATCTLNAPATVNVGMPLDIKGADFPASSTIDVSIGLEGATPDEFSVQSDSGGAFTISLTPELSDVGKTTVVATAGSACTAQAVFTVTGTATTPTPVATPSPREPAPTAAGRPPRTDTEPRVPGAPNGPMTTWALALVVLLIGAGGVLTTRRARQR